MQGLRAGRPEAAAVIWDWREQAESAPAESTGRARLRGVIQGSVALAVGAGFLLWGRTTIASVVFCVGSVILLAALVSPTGLFAGIEGLFATLGRWTGRLLTWILMLPLFYLFFLPFGALLRRGRRDRLLRFYEREANTYWEPHTGPRAGSSSRERQY
jgi:hypothetical protein